MRMVESADLAVGSEDARLKRIVQVEEPGAAGVEAISEQVIVRPDEIFGVVRMRAGEACRNAGDDMAVASRIRVSIDHAQEIAGGVAGIAGPDIKVRVLGLRCRKRYRKTEDCQKGKCDPDAGHGGNFIVRSRF